MSVEPDADLQLSYAACISQAMGFARYTSLSICTLAKLAPFLTLQLVCFHVSATVRKVPDHSDFGWSVHECVIIL